MKLFCPASWRSHKLQFAASALALAIFTPSGLWAQCTLNGNPDPGCTLNGPQSITTYTDGASTTTVANGTLTLSGPGAIGIQSLWRQNGDVTLAGTGTLTLTGGQMGADGNGRTLNNQINIAGTGVIGSNVSGITSSLFLNNSGTVNANASGNTLTLSGTGVTNSNLLEATSGGVLVLATGVNNNSGGGGSIVASGGTVNVSTTIQGGTLTTTGGGVMQTVGSATLDGTGAITLSDGSTYTAGSATTTAVDGTLALGTTTGSTLSLSGSLRLQGTTSLTTTSGILAMNGGQIETDGNGRQLINAGTINGSGVIGSNGGLAFTNSGTVNANAASPLVIAASNGVSNTGTFEATAGGTLTLVSSPINNNGGLISSSGAGSTVNVSTTIQGGSLTTSSAGVIQTSGTATLDGLSVGQITLTNGSTYTAGGGATTNVFGTLALGTTTGSTLSLSGSLRLQGTTSLTTTSGILAMNGGQIETDGNGRQLINAGTINGSGVIGSNGGLAFTNSGTVNANAASPLVIAASNGVSNTGTFKATGGTLTLVSSPINNSGGVIASLGTGSTVNVNTTVEGGTLTTTGAGLLQTRTSATLDGSSVGAITISDGSTYTGGAGTTTNALGQLNLGTIGGGHFALAGNLRLTGDLTLSGPGALVMGGGQVGTDGNGRTLSIASGSTVNGFGAIGSNASGISPNLSLSNAGTINANSSGNILSIGGNGGSITNTGLLEATGGGVLALVTSAAITNTGANITSTGAGSTVNVSTAINGGTLNTLGGGLMQTAGSATLNSVTISDASTYTAGTSTTTNASGTLTLGTATGGTLALSGLLRLTTDLGLAGPGSVSMTGGQIGTDGNGRTLTIGHTSTIKGFGAIGSSVSGVSPNLSLNNAGTVNANSSGNILSIGGNGGSITNTGLFEATGGGILTLATATPINNAGGNITATGTGSMVNVSTTIQGGTLNTSAGGLMQTVGSAALDAATGAGAITISDGSTYTAGAGTLTTSRGTLNLGTVAGGTLALTGSLRLNGDLALSGPGSLTMTGGLVGTDGNGRTLTNNATIFGFGTIAANTSNISSNLAVNNASTGTIESNGAGQSLTINGSGFTNTGTMQANAGSTLLVTAPLSGTTFSSNTLNVGTYNAFTSGTIQINGLGSTGGEIHTNAATILLDGANSNIQDGAALNALSSLSDNASTGSFTIQNGRDFTSLSPFSNEGILKIGSTSTFFTGAGGGGSYTQNSGTTTVDGTLDPLMVNISAGLLDGAGLVDGALTVGLNGLVTPGDVSSTGTLTVDGTYTQNGTLNIGIASTGNDFLDINGLANLGGTLDLVALDGFTLAGGESFFLLEDGTRAGTFNTVNTAGLDLAAGLTAQVLYDKGANHNEVELLINGGTSATPEPGTWFMLAVGLGALLLLRRKAARA